MNHETPSLMQVDAVPTRVAVIGAGRMGQRAIEILLRNSAADVRAVVDPDRVRAAAVADRFGLAAHPSMDALVGIVDAVYIATPSAGHADQCIAAADHGFDVLVDKPLCLTELEGQRIAEAVARAGTRLMVGFSYRYRAEWRQARAWIRDGRIGDVTVINDVIVEAATDTPDWYWDPASGGGVIQLQSHHLVDRIAWIVGAPVIPRAAVVGDEGERSERHLAVLATARDVPVSIVIGFADGYDDAGAAHFLVQGERGHIVVDSGARTATLVAAGAAPVVVDAADDDWFDAELRAFIARPTPDEPGIDDGRAAVVAATQVMRLVADARLGA